MRLIDAEALKAKWYEVNDIDENDKGARFVGYTEIARLIDQAPTVSADSEPTVIRSKTLMPTKDFKEWAKRIREENPNVIVIPCDAEVVSAESVVRCKDCRHRDLFSCPLTDNDFQKDEDFCSWAERREP